MIARLTGLVDTIGPDFAVIDVHGVGYQLSCSRRTLATLGPAGSPARLHVETLMREDAIHLYGFADEAERDMFRLLQTVQGVGARVALAVLGLGEPGRLAAAIAGEERAFLNRADGVGPRLSQRIVAELKERMAGRAAVLPAAAAPDGAVAEAVSALVHLGYSRSEAESAVGRARRSLGDGAPVEALVPAALKALAT